MRFLHYQSLLVVLLVFGTFALAKAEEPEKGKADSEIKLAGGKLTLTAPKGWLRKKPRSRIVAHEFAVPKVKKDREDGRITFMSAGGGIEANIARWRGQFSQPGGKSTKERTTVKKLKISGQTVHFVDISGTFNERRAPFAGGGVQQKKDYRMLALIIETERLGQFFVKLTGPKDTIAANEEAFNKLTKSLQVH